MFKEYLVQFNAIVWNQAPRKVRGHTENES